MPSTTFEIKAKARSWARKLLRSVPEEERERKSRAAATIMTESGIFRKADIVFLFLSMRREIDTAPLIEICLRQGKTVAVPRIEGDDIVFAILRDDWRSWQLDSFGIPAVPRDCAAIQPDRMHGENVLIAVPGLLFDIRGGRLGRGKGYYDRFLGKTRESCAAYFTTAGYCYAMQIVDRIPCDERDIPVDALICELMEKSKAIPRLDM